MFSEPTFRVPSALELTPEKLHDFLSLASSPSLVDTGSPGSSVKSEPASELRDEGMDCVGSPPPPSFAQVVTENVWFKCIPLNIFSLSGCMLASIIKFRVNRLLDVIDTWG